jgi:DNA-binding MarR family transcriptional regulator
LEKMALAQELGLRRNLQTTAHEALLNIYFTGILLRKKASQFLEPYGITEVQFNMIMILRHQSGPAGGLTQAELSGMMLSNKANITSLVDRMERDGWVIRTSHPEDRRSNIIMLTAKARRLLDKVDPLYGRMINQIMRAIPESQQKTLISYLEQIRSQMNE